MKDINIRHIKLVNGEEIISLVDKIESDNVILEFPMLLNTIFDNTSTYTYYFTRWMALADDDDHMVSVNLRNIIAYSNVKDAIKEKYIRTSMMYKEDSQSTDALINKQMEDHIKSSSNDNNDYDDNDTSDDTILH